MNNTKCERCGKALNEWDTYNIGCMVVCKFCIKKEECGFPYVQSGGFTIKDLERLPNALLEKRIEDKISEKVVERNKGTLGELPMCEKRQLEDSVQREISGIVVAFNDESVEVRLDSQSIVLFPRILFKNRDDLLSKGQMVKYQIMKRSDNTRFQRFVEDVEPNAERGNKDLFDLWDSIPSE